MNTPTLIAPCQRCSEPVEETEAVGSVAHDDYLCTDCYVPNADHLSDISRELGLDADMTTQVLRGVGYTVTADGRVYGQPECHDRLLAWISDSDC